MLGVNGRHMFETWYQMEALLLSGRLELEEIVTHQLGLEGIRRAVQVMQSGEGMEEIVLNVGG